MLAYAIHCALLSAVFQVGSGAPVWRSTASSAKIFEQITAAQKEPFADMNGRFENGLGSFWPKNEQGWFRPEQMIAIKSVGIFLLQMVDEVVQLAEKHNRIEIK